NKPGRSPVAPASVHSGGGGLLWSYAWTFSWLARCRSSKLPSENSLPSVMSSATSPPVENIPGHRDHRSGDHHPLITIIPESRSRSFGIVDHHRPESAREGVPGFSAAETQPRLHRGRILSECGYGR